MQDWYIDKATGKQGCRECDQAKVELASVEMQDGTVYRWRVSPRVERAITRAIWYLLGAATMVLLRGC